MSVNDDSGFRKSLFHSVATAGARAGVVNDGNVDAIQLELAQRNYMDEDSYLYDEFKAARVQTVIRRMLQACV